MKHTLALILAILSSSAHADWFTDKLVEYAIGDVEITEYKQPNGDVWLITHGGPIKPAKCGYVEYKNVVPCMQAFVGTSRLLDVKAQYPQCFFENETLIPEDVRVECVRLNPFVVASSIFGNKNLYDINAILAWRDGGRVGSIPTNKLGTVVSGTVCETRIVVQVGKDIVGIATNAEGVRGAVLCK
jgi:hypothetical protein